MFVSFKCIYLYNEVEMRKITNNSRICFVIVSCFIFYFYWLDSVEVSRWGIMEGADGSEELLDWEALYRSPVQNSSFNTTEWVPSTWNTSVANTSWLDESAPFDSASALLRAAAKAVLLGLLILATVVGRIFILQWLTLWNTYIRICENKQIY